MLISLKAYSKIDLDIVGFFYFSKILDDQVSISYDLIYFLINN